MSDEGVSELLGYAILTGMVVTAVILIASGAAGVISSSAESATLSEAALAVKSFAATAMNAAHANNSYFTASEMQVPAGYDLIVLDRDDDVTRFNVSCGGGELFNARMGSVRLRSPFRSVSFEGGAVFRNDSGSIGIIRKPSVFVASHEGGRTLYVFLTGTSTEPGVISGSSPAVINVRTESRHNVRLPVGGPVKISISSMDPGGWSAILRDEGFSVTCNGRAVTATAEGISDVCIDYATLRVRIG